MYSIFRSDKQSFRPFVRLISLIMLLGMVSFWCMPETEAKAYNLEAPTMSYEDYKNADYTQIFVGGRNIEYTDSTDYPYKKNKKLMVSVESICKAIYGIYSYDAKKKTATITRHGVKVTMKAGSKKISINDHGKKRTVKTKVANTIKDGELFVTIAGISDALGLELKSNKKTGVINLNYDFEDFKYIDLKNNKNNLVSLSKLKNAKYNKVILDMVEVPKDYINVLKNTDQYKAIIEDGTLLIFSCQLISNADYIFGNVKEWKKQFASGTKVSVKLENIQNSMELDMGQRENIFFFDACKVLWTDLWPDFKESDEKNGNEVFGVQHPKGMSLNQQQYQEVLKRAKEILEEEKNF